MEPERFDLVIIGAGSGNSIPTAELAALRIAIIDDGAHFGGTCLNVGCIPTKMFLHPGRIVSEVREAEHLGVHGEASAQWPQVRDRIFGRIDAISEAGEQYRASGEPNISLIRERVHFVDRQTLETVSGRRLQAERIVIAAGSRPRELSQLPFGPRVLSSDELLRLEQLPNDITVVGGGVIAAEFAFMLHAYGVKVTQLVRGEMLSAVDRDIARTFTAVASRRWDVRERTEVVAAEIPDDSEQPLELSLSDGTALNTELVLVATGRIPNTDRLATQAAGFDHYADGRLVVDDAQRVLAAGEPLSSVYALGDVTNAHQLKHVANEEARIVVANLTSRTGEPVRNTLHPVPMAIFTDPEIATFGATLADAQAAGMDAFEVRQDYSGTAWGWALEDTEHFAKLVVDREHGQLLGAHIIGRDAAILLQPLVQAAAFGMSVENLARGQYWPHPAASEIIENLLLTAEKEYNT